MTFFTELKRRNVYKVAVAYVVVGWLLIQVATQTFPFFEIPNWIVRAVILLLCLGFPVALVLAWAFDLTPEGVQRAESGSPATIRSSGRAWLYIAGVGALVSLALFFAGRLSAPQPPSRPAEKSLAVLPFENLSEDKANAYFADGMQDEIITRLAKIGELRIISRNSTARYRSKAENIAEIARQLGVAHLVEGSVQKVGDRVRINVQLIDAQSDEHLWAELYDRDLTDIFAVQSEVATNIAKTLQAKLSGREEKAITAKPTEKLAAYDAYLRGLDLISRPGQAPEDMKKAASAFSDAVRRDPKFAKAWAAFAQANAALVFNRVEVSSPRETAARIAADQATRLDPTAAETLLANAYIRYHIERDYSGARALFEQLRHDVPSSSEAVTALARIARRQSRWKESLSLYDEATRLNPRDAQLWMDRAWTYSMLRDYAHTEEMLARAHAIAPEDTDVITNESVNFQNSGQLAAARAILERASVSGKNDQLGALRTNQLILERRFPEALAAAEQTIASNDEKTPTEGGIGWQTVGWLRAVNGDKMGARAAFSKGKEALEKLRQEQPQNQFFIVRLALCEAGLGNKEAALRTAEEAVAMLPATKDPVYGPLSEESLAEIEAQVGEVDRAITRIERLLVTPYGAFPLTQALLRIDPIWDSLRADPRFKAIVNGPEPKTIYN